MPSSVAGTASARSGQAISLICLGVLCLVVNDTLAKWLTAHYAPLQIVFLRHLLATPLVAVIVMLAAGPGALRTRRLRPHALRGLFQVCGAIAFFLGLRSLPLAEATSLIFAAPIFITALSVPLLGEQVGWRRWAAVMVGFLGVLIIVRPGAAAFQSASLFVVAAALLYALMMISARWVDSRDSGWTMMFYVMLCPLVFSGLAVPFVWQMPQLAHLPYFLGMAVFGTVAMTLISQAFRLAPAAVVAPFDYTALIWASLFGWLVWGEIPSGWTYAGAAVIMASGVFIVCRETRRAAS